MSAALLAVAISEIPLQIDKYFLYQEQDARFGAVAGINVSIATFCLIALYAMWILKSVANPIRRSSGRLVYGGVLPLYVLMIAASALYAINPLLTICDVSVVLQAYMFYFYIANRVGGRTISNSYWAC